MRFKKWLAEGLSLKGNYKGGYFQRLVAAFYMMAPRTEPDAVLAYEDLGRKLVRQKKMLDSKFVMRPTSDDPYKSSKHLARAIDQQRGAGVRKPVVNVYSASLGPNETPGQKGHPIWNREQDYTFGWIHDLVAHYYGKHPFSARGEYGAYLQHLKTLCNMDQVKGGGCPAAKVLFTEIVGQTSYYYVYGDYPPQKAIILRHFDHFNVGRLDPQSPLNDFFAVQGKDLVKRRPFSVDELAGVDPRLPETLRSQEDGFRSGNKTYDLASL